MNPWIIIALIGAAIVFFLDYILRRKKWKNNTKAEKISLLINMLSVSVYIFSSVLGLLWGITGSSADTTFGEIIYNVTLAMAGFIGVIAIVAMIGSLILRKKGKAKASIWINIFALGYIIVVFAVNSLTGLI